ncbi:hypothetical protein B0H11DRAFT_2003080 [Mycena galericulata]|nr:hypothetical protein B0H11DRAFT_2003080 [Mycena galericulata]
MSELDSLSDSEWLEISSNQESDNDSLSSRDSDRDDLHSMPPSRRSSISIASSGDGEIDAWEGLVDETDHIFAESDPVVDAFAAAEHAGPHRMLDSDGSVSEEQFVTAALEQSLVGTLSASRSSSLGLPSTVHNSLRDLRLSFPDPLTSSRDELNRSYEAVSSTETNCITDDVPNSPMTTAFPEDSPPLHAEPPLKDESNSPDIETLSEFHALPVHRWDIPQINGFDVVLYPSTAQSRDFARWLLSVLATGSERPRFSNVTFREGPVPSSQTLDRPSLAIVSLPQAFSRFAHEHTLYLPVVFPSMGSSLTASESWSSLNIPAVRTVRLIKDSESHIVVDALETRKRVDPKFLLAELEPLSTHSAAHTKKVQGMLDQLRPVHAVTFVALLSLIMGFAVNTAFRSPSLVPASTTVAITPAQPTPSTFWGMFATTPNSSVAPLSTASAGNMAVMPSTVKDFALAVFNPATTTPSIQFGSISVVPSPSGACGQGTTGSPVGECKLRTWSGKAKTTKDIIVRPPTALSNPPSVKALPTDTPSVGGTVVKVSARPVEESAVTSLSLKLSDSLSEIAETMIKAVEEVVARDFKELKNALDALMRAIGRQTTMIVEDSKSRAQVLRERLQYRNDRARDKARELKQMGEQFVSIAGERFKARAELAKTRAHSLKKSLMSTTAWRTYAEAHGEWAERLTKKGRRRDGKREHKGGLFAKLKEKRENRKKRVSI